MHEVGVEHSEHFGDDAFLETLEEAFVGEEVEGAVEEGDLLDKRVKQKKAVFVSLLFGLQPHDDFFLHSGLQVEHFESFTQKFEDGVDGVRL